MRRYDRLPSPHRYHPVHIIRQFSHPRRAVRRVALTRAAKDLSLLFFNAARAKRFRSDRKKKLPCYLFSRARDEPKRHPISNFTPRSRFYLRSYPGGFRRACEARYPVIADNEPALREFLAIRYREKSTMQFSRFYICWQLPRPRVYRRVTQINHREWSLSVSLSLSLTKEGFSEEILRRGKSTSVSSFLVLPAGFFLPRRPAPFSRETELRSDAS